MAKLLTVVMPALEQLPTGEYSVTIGDEELHHGQQTFKAASVEELCGKLAMSCQHGTAHIRELTRELEDLRGDYQTTHDITNLLVALLLVKHIEGESPSKSLDRLIRSLTKDLTARLPDPPVTHT